PEPRARSPAAPPPAAAPRAADGRRPGRCRATAALPSDETLKGHVTAILEGQDLTKTSMKDVRGLLEARCGLAEGTLSNHKAKVKDIVTAKIAELQEAGQDEGTPAAGQPSTPPRSAGSKETGSGRKSGELGGTKRRQAGLFTRGGFMKKARTFPVKLGDSNFSVPPREFSTGSCGFFLSAKVPMEMDGQKVMMQCSLNCTVIGSKEWKKD
ncbi:unnamed protein product, partial [Prorocentrum cordatum]